MIRSSVAALGALAVIGATVTAMQVSSPPERPTAAITASEPLLTATRICPRLRNVEHAVGTRVGVAAAGGPGQRGGTGSLSAAEVGGQASYPTKLARTGTALAGLPGSVSRDSAVLTATGALAGGLTAEQVTRGAVLLERGIAAVRCTAPQAESWFVGAATTVNAQANLVLVNPDATAATADIDLIGTAGELTVPDAQGILVAPHSRRVISLADLAPDEKLLTLRVQARTGRLASAVEQLRGTPRHPGGIDWLPPVESASRRLVIPGVPDGSGRRSLVVTNPTGTASTFTVSLTTGDATFVPTGLDAVPLAAHTTGAVDLTKALAGASAAVTLTGDAPLVAAVDVTATSADGPLSDFAWAGPARPLTGSALLPAVGTDGATDETLYLTATGRAAKVSLVPLPVVGIDARLPAPTAVQIPADRTVAVSLRDIGGKRARDPVRVVVQTAGATVYAGRFILEHGGRGPLVGWLPASTEPATVAVPPVAADPLAATHG